MKESCISCGRRHGGHPRQCRRAQGKLAGMQRTLSKMKKYCKNYYKQKRKIARLHAHIANQRKDFLRKHSGRTTSDYDCAAIESLDMKAMRRAFSFGESADGNGWGMSARFLDISWTNKGSD
ncbi:MAG: transposase [Clostridiales bacterium]|nr:transposase [Clostridiales bacterium]